MKNLILGSNGFIGSHLSEFLIKNGETVIKFVGDLTTDEIILKNIDRVYFLAWNVGGSSYLYNTETQTKQLKINTLILNKVMTQLEKYKTQFVFASSLMAENKESPYGILKRLGESWTDCLGNRSVRIWNTYGPGKWDRKNNHAITDWIKSALESKKIIMRTDGEEMRQFTYVQDICSAMRESFSYKGVLDATNYHWIHIKKVAELIAEKTGSELIKGTISGSDFREFTQYKKNISNWTPETSLIEGISKTIEESKKYEKL